MSPREEESPAPPQAPGLKLPVRQHDCFAARLLEKPTWKWAHAVTPCCSGSTVRDHASRPQLPEPRRRTQLTPQAGVQDGVGPSVQSRTRVNTSTPQRLRVTILSPAFLRILQLVEDEQTPVTATYPHPISDSLQLPPLVPSPSCGVDRSPVRVVPGQGQLQRCPSTLCSPLRPASQCHTHDPICPQLQAPPPQGRGDSSFHCSHCFRVGP